jgi:hypothetical protein
MSEKNGVFYIQNRKNIEGNYHDPNLKYLDKNNQNGLLSNITGIEGFVGNFSELRENGPVAKENMEDFKELKDLQNMFNRQLQEYNKAIQILIENSQDYISASNYNNNKFANTYLRDPTGAVGYVTNRGVWKHLPNPTMGNSMQGKNYCPNNWSSAPTISADDGEQYSIATAPVGEIVKTGGTSLIKGTSILSNQSCGSAGQNIYITNPNPTKNRRYVECSKNPGWYQSDLGRVSLEACAKRAEDLGSNRFQMGPNHGGVASCHIGGGGNTVINPICSVAPGQGRFGRNKSGYWGNTGGNSWWNWSFGWIPGYTAYATYDTDNANKSNLGETYHITDDLTKKKYPSNMIDGYGDDFQLLSGYNSYGNDIVRGSGLTVEQIKKKCLETPGAAGFYINGNNYWIKNANMWPRGNRQYTGGDLYIRNTKVVNDHSCSNKVNFSQQNQVGGYINDGYMNMNTTCALGTISKKDMVLINDQYSKLNGILEQIHQKINELSKEDVKLNNRLLDEYKNLKNKLNKYEHTYKEIHEKVKLIKHNDAIEDDSNLQMLSYNQKYILWSMLALGATAGAMKIMK